MEFYSPTDNYWVTRIAKPSAVFMFAEDRFICPDAMSNGESFWYVRRKTEEDQALVDRVRDELDDWRQWNGDWPWMVYAIPYTELPF